MTFKVGETVRLNSGGPTMTVAVVQGPVVGCVWFDGMDRKTGEFMAEMLEHVTKGIGVGLGSK